MEFSSSLTLLSLDKSFLLEKRIDLLKAIDKQGSISKAAKQVPMSYKSAWDAIDNINNLCPKPVVIKETGGKGGGGAKLTSYGRNLVKSYCLLQTEHQKFLSRLTKITDFDTGDLKSIKRVAMQISARNQIQGVIKSIKKDKVNSTINIKLKSGYSIISVITNNAVEDLSLDIDDEVIAIFKSNSVLLEENLNKETKNKFQAKIINIDQGEIDTQLSLDIGGDILICVINNDCTKSFKIDEKIQVVIRASDVMIGK